MKKTYFSIPVLIAALLLVGASCGNKDKKINTQNQQSNTSQNRQSFFDNENFTDAKLSDLKVGSKILVMASANSDGSATAEGILVGASQEALRGIMRTGMGRASSTPFNGNAQKTQNAQGQRPDSSRFQNMSQEERQKFMEERMKERGVDMPSGQAGMQRGGTNGARTGMKTAGGQSRTNINGEILSINSSTITIKLADGGSKIIFISSDITVKKIKESSSAPQTQ